MNTVDRARADAAIDEIMTPPPPPVVVPDPEPRPVNLIDFLLTEGVRFTVAIKRGFRRRRVMATLTTKDRNYIKARVAEIQADDAFAIPVRAYKILHDRFCNASMSGGSCSGYCRGEKEKKRLDDIITDIYGTKEQILGY